ncbi:MAG TPA: methyltransferase [Candidatus Thermoplasmatota archaeon]|nr:methyltransferase [Candidatus Thermoplasmatota archaeon]
MRGETLFRIRMPLLYSTLVAGELAGAALHRAFPAASAPLVGVVTLPSIYLLLVPGTPEGWAPAYLVPAGLAAAAYVLRAWATAYLGFAVVGGRRLRTERLVVDGPYAFVRNPLYAGLVLLGAAVGVASPPPALALVVLGLGLLVAALARAEERRLAPAHPEWAEYARHVPRLVPRPTPWRAASASRARARPYWVEGLVGEAWQLSVVVGFLALATPVRSGAPIAVLLALLAWAAAVRSRRLPFPRPA